MNSDNVNKLVEELGKRFAEAAKNADKSGVVNVNVVAHELKGKLTAAEWDTLAFDYLISMARERGDNLRMAEVLIALQKESGKQAA